MAKAYLEAADTAFTINNANVLVYGQEESQAVTLSLSAYAIVIDQNIEEVIFPKPSYEYAYEQTGNIITVRLNGLLIATITVQGDADGTKFTFANGSVGSILTGGVMKLGAASSTAIEGSNARSIDSKMVIPAPTPAPAPDPTPSPPPAPPSDTTAPTLSSSSPIDNATAVATNSNIVLTFSENVSAVAGKNVTIKKTSDNSTAATIDAADGQITVAANVATINPTSDLSSDTEYYVLIDSGAFKDSLNNVYTGISSTTALSFTTPDTIAPTLSSSTPADNATVVATNSNIVLTLSENITAVTGKNITIKKTSDNSVVTAIDAADAQVSVAANVVTINPTSDLAVGTEYYVLIDSGAFKDSANNVYAGIGSTTAFSFRTDPVVYLANIAAGIGGFAINGEAGLLNFSGYSVSSAGDVNGDGLADLIIGAYGVERSYIIFGKSDTTTVNLTTIAAGTGGFAINGEVVGDYSGYSVSSAGDVNGDGLADLIVGYFWSFYTEGRSYIIFGKSDGAAVNLTTIASGFGGFINDEAGYAFGGYSVSSAGDVNGDGLADLIVGAYGNDTIAADAGRSYVVFGKNGNTTAVSLTDIAVGTGGFAINGEAASDGSGISVSSAGDVNGDGLADLIVGASGNDITASGAGRSYVVFGKSDGTVVNLSTIVAGTGGFAINGEAADHRSGASVSSAGDINGDGLADLIVGAYGVGRSYIVFGKSDTTTVNLATIAAGTGGFAINGETTDDESGYSVSSAGDVNGDGLADLIVGANKNDATATDAGRSYVVFGKSDTTAVSPTDIAAGTGGFAINGEAAGDYSGVSVSSAGDVNGDGLADLIVGAYGNSLYAGRTYIIFGGSQWLTVSISGAGAVNGTASSEALIGSSSSDTLTGGGGIDRFYSGDSDDVIVLTSSDITNLADNTVASQKAMINGGGDTDTIRLTAGANLDLTAIANQGASGVEENSRIESIEKIDLATDTTANILTLTVNDVIDMSGMNLFNTTNGWTNGTYTLGASVSKHQIIVDGDATDSLIINAGNGVWANGGNVTNGAATYNVYNNVASNSQILILDVVGVVNNDA